MSLLCVLFDYAELYLPGELIVVVAVVTINTVMEAVNPLAVAVDEVEVVVDTRTTHHLTR